MKTTIEISDSLLMRSRRLTRKEHTSLRELVEEGLQLVLDRRESARREPVQPVTFKGEGLSEEFCDRGWSDIRDAAYSGRGA